MVAKKKEPMRYYFEVTDPKTDKLVREDVEVLKINKRGDQYRISKEETERLLQKWGYDLPFEIMCKEYGQDSDWCGIYADDLYNEDGEEDPEHGKLDDDYKTFEIWDGDGDEDGEPAYMQKA